MNLGRLTYNNLVDKGTWKTETDSTKEDPAEKYLALATEILRSYQKSEDTNRRPSYKGRCQAHENWRYNNPDNLKEKIFNGKTLKWCTNDCHRRPQWCARKNCLSREEYRMKQRVNEEKNVAQDGADQFMMKVTRDFKMAFAALTTEEDFKALEEQFFSVKE